MAYEETQKRISLDADASIGSYTGPPGQRGTTGPYWGLQYRFVKLTGAHQAGLSTAKADPTVGVLQNKPQQVGDAATVTISGVTFMQSGGVIAATDPLTCDATGRAIKAVGADQVLAIAVDAAAAVDQMFPALLV